MCRCCQSCLEDLYWGCVGEKFCYDESIANYNADDDEYFQKKNNILSPVQQSDNNNMPICAQPINRNNSNISFKIHEEDYRREIQTSVPILAPEIMSVFANSQIFVEHPSKMTKNLTKTCLPALHTKSKEDDKEKLIKQLEGDLEITETTTSFEKKIKFTIASDSSPEPERSLSSTKFSSIIEEEDSFKDEVILRPRAETQDVNDYPKPTYEKKPLRNVQSVPYFSFRPASENDIFAISGSLSRISMTPEVPSISYSTLPKNYEDTPNLDKYKESVSLYSIQTANQARVIQSDFSMPRYFRKSGLIGQSTENVPPNKDDPPKRLEKSKRLKHLRGSLPPLLIHTVLGKKEDIKHVD